MTVVFALEAVFPCWKVNLQVKYMGSIIVFLFEDKLK